MKSGKSLSKKDNLVSDFLLRASLNMSYHEVISLPEIATDKECEDYLQDIDVPQAIVMNLDLENTIRVY